MCVLNKMKRVRRLVWGNQTKHMGKQEPTTTNEGNVLQQR